ncbi:hypothetical protein BN1708_002721 [Verticillium longisporum]|uniref:Uncharacterized protein n=1 Tax=Verticillium longisporum TaxID=100787 RepID=A0A0G4L0B4_VERLO|nr:hypothetical protein BN1708_002721 [Verticillium longisporum]
MRALAFLWKGTHSGLASFLEFCLASGSRDQSIGTLAVNKAMKSTEPKVEEPKIEAPKVEETPATGTADAPATESTGEADKPVTAQSSVFSMFGGGAKKEKKPEDEDRGDNSGSNKAQREAAAAAADDEQAPESEDVHFEPSSNSANPAMRMPIDLASFLTIDPRQMNRNLAHLTGLAERTEMQKGLYSRIVMTGKKAIKASLTADSQAASILQKLLSAIFVFGLVYGLDSYLYRSHSDSPATYVSLPKTTVADLTTLVPDSTSVINLTSSSTAVDIPRIVATPGNVALMPFSNLFPDILPDASKGSIVCTAELYGQHEILIKIPAGTKTTWLNKDSITIDVLRGGQIVKTKFSSVDEGLVLDIPKRDAYGVVAVTVVTNRRPKINETLEVDFGRGILTEALHGGKRLLFDLASTASEATSSLKEQALVKAQEVSDYGTGASDSLKHTVVQKWHEIESDLTERLHRTADFSDKLDLSVVTAQIRSRLWWLRIQGKMEEHAEYEKKARVFLARRRDEIHKASQSRSKTHHDVSACQPGGSRWSKRCGD